MLIIVAIGLLISGITVWPAIPELKFGLIVLEKIGLAHSELAQFTETILLSLQHIESEHPHILYGYDWLAFAHIVLAILFWGAARDPLRNKWIVECGLIMCALIPLLALICIPYREIPWWWFFMDFAFAPAAALPLWTALTDIRTIESSSTQTLRP